MLQILKHMKFVQTSLKEFDKRGIVREIAEEMKRDKENLREITIEEIEKVEKPVRIGVICDRVFERLYGEPEGTNWVRIWHIGNQVQYIVEDLDEEGLISFDGVFVY